MKNQNYQGLLEAQPAKKSPYGDGWASEFDFGTAQRNVSSVRERG